MAYLGREPQVGFTETVKDSFNGDNSTTAFTMSQSVSLDTDIEVFVGNVQQEPGSGKAYTVSGTTLTFSEAPPTGTANIYVVHRNSLQGTILPPQNLGDRNYLIGGNLSLDTDSAVLNFGADSDINLTHVADTGLTTNNDFSLKSDSSVLKFGNDEEITVTHVADTGLNIKHTATGDDKPVVLTLQTGETDIAQDDVLGTINFQAPDESTGTDAILVAAGISAISEGDFSSSSNATKLSFKTGASEAAAEKMSLSSAGLLTVSGRIITDDTTEATSTTDGSLQTDGGLSVAKDIVAGDDVKLLSDSAVLSFGADSEIQLIHVADDGLILKHTGTGDGKEPSLTFQAGDNDIAQDDVLGSIFFQAPDEGAGTDAVLVAAGIEAVSEGDFSASSNATSLVFKTGASEAANTKMTLTSGGKLSLGVASGGDAVAGGMHIHSGSAGSVSANSNGDELVVESSGRGGISILTPDANESNILFGSPSDNLGGFITYKQSNTTMEIGTSISSGLVKINTGDGSLHTTFEADGDLNIKDGNLVLDSGHGIDFGDTGDGSATMVSELLDDYEEGTFTYGTNANIGFQTNTNVGRYHKIGNLVTLQVQIDIASVSGTNHFYINGLPYGTVANSTNTYNGNAVGTCMHYNLNVDDSMKTLTPYIGQGGSTTIYFYENFDNANWDILTNSSVTSTTEFIINISYIAA